MDDDSPSCACVHTYPRAPPSTGNGIFRSGHPVTLFIDRCLSPPLSFGTPTRNEVVESHVEISFPPLNCVTRDILYSVRYLSDNFLRARERSFGSGKIRPNKFRGLPRTWGNGIDRGEPFVRSLGRSCKSKSIDPMAKRNGII